MLKYFATKKKNKKTEYDFKNEQRHNERAPLTCHNWRVKTFKKGRNWRVTTFNILLKLLLAWESSLKALFLASFCRILKPQIEILDKKESQYMSIPNARHFADHTVGSIDHECGLKNCRWRWLRHMTRKKPNKGYW